MRRCFRLMIVLILFGLSCFGQGAISLCSWNVKDFGKSKSGEEIILIAELLNAFDVVALQEIVAGYGGAQAVSLLTDALNRMGSKWEYSVSEPTVSSSYKQERYAFLWKTDKLKMQGDAWLEQRYQLELDREPYYATFLSGEKSFTVVNFHAITKSKQPETEIKFFKFLPGLYPSLHLIFAGDFNCPQSHTVFNPLKKMGYQPALLNQKTSLRQQCINNDCLASEFDNIFYDATVLADSAGVVHFYQQYPDFTKARLLSDHVPVFLKFYLN
jgi:deoxyribonuclease-1-like protein